MCVCVLPVSNVVLSQSDAELVWFDMLGTRYTQTELRDWMTGSVTCVYKLPHICSIGLACLLSVCDIMRVPVTGQMLTRQLLCARAVLLCHRHSPEVVKRFGSGWLHSVDRLRLGPV